MADSKKPNLTPREKQDRFRKIGGGVVVIFFAFLLIAQIFAPLIQN